MKKRKFKNYLKLGILFLGISFLLWSCEEQENYLSEEHLAHQQHKTPTFQVLNKEFLNKDVGINSTLKTLKFFENSFHKNSTIEDDYLYSELYGFYIDTKYAILNTNENIKTYTFKVERTVPKENVLENLIVHSDTLTNSTKYFLIEYPQLADSYDYTAVMVTEIHDDSLTFNKTNNIECYDVLQFEESVTTDYPCWSGEHSGGSQVSSCDTSGGGNPPFSITTPSSWILVEYCPPPGSDELTYGDSSASYNTGGGSGGLGNVQTIPLNTFTAQWTNFLNNLTHAQRDFIEDNDDVYGELNEFFADNSFSFESFSFASEAILALIDGDEVDFDDKIITSLPECLDKIFNKLKVVSNGKISNIFAQFRGTNPVPQNYNWSLKAGNCTNGASGCTNATISNSKASTTIDTLVTANATDFSMARTMIHELVHAYLVSVYRFQNIDKNYVNLMNQFAAQYNNNANDVHHQIFITENLINPIGQALYDWAQLSGYYNVPGGLNYFKELAWGGLTHYRDSSGNLVENPNFINLVPLQSVRQRIVEISAAELTNQTIGVNSPKGQKACN